MFSRRMVLGMLALPLLAHAGTPPVVRLGEDVEAPRKGSVVAMRPGARTVHAMLGARVKPTSVDVIPINNANTEFQLRVLYKKRAQDSWLYLQLDGTWYRSESMGHDDRASDGTFQLDRATAHKAAAAFGIPFRERRKLDAGLTWTWVIPQTATTDVKAPLPAKVRVTNAGTVPVGFAVGGRQRGARDNRFVFKIARNGVPVTIKDAPDFGGVMGYQKLAPGESVELSADLRSWFAFDQPGHYAVDAAYEGELQKDGSSRSTVAELADLWDVSLGGQGGILIK